ncbi:MAG: YfhO family protein [Erysipelotrichaceae bacterium]|nr:YfhO family protein [Erysipelotrichaceae bacterium]
MKKKEYLFLLTITILFMFPYIINNRLPIEHDTFFHLSRIEGYATALKNWDVLPKIYFFKNQGFGYASPIFYNDLFLLIPSILYNLGFSLSFTYKLTVFIATFLSSLSMFYLLKRIDKNPYSPYIASFIYTFSNYHITDTYVRGALGEMFAFIFLPLVLCGIYNLLYDNKNWKMLCFSFMGLLLSHNISFIFGLIILYIFCVFNFKNFKFFKGVIIAGIICFILSLWYFIPLLEGILSHDIYLNYYKDSSLDKSTLNFLQLFENKTIFGYGLKSNLLFMNVSLGWFITIVPIMYIFKKNKDKFVSLCMFIGYVALILTLDFIPVSFINLIATIQFAWRLNTIAMVCLSIPAAISFSRLCNKKIYLIIISFIFTIEAVYHLYPVLNRNFFITNKTKYEHLLAGEIIDPFYYADYNRIELAGADYLPIKSPDFRYHDGCIYSNNTKITCDFSRKYNNISFDVDRIENITLPITYYKGYVVYINDKKINTFESNNGLVEFTPTEIGTYTLKYQWTFLQKISFIISLFSFGIYIIFNFILNPKIKRVRIKSKIN